MVVSGDFTLDWNLARSRGLESQRGVWEPEVGSRLRWQRGGAGLLADLMEGVAAQIRDLTVFEIRQPATPRRASNAADAQIGPEDARFHHSYASWESFPFAVGKGSEKENPAWRVKDFLGINRRSGTETVADWARVVNDNSSAQVVVLDDADLGFRSKPELWPASLTGSHPWVLVKMSRPVAQGELWDHLCEHHAKKLIVVMTVNDLRLTEVQISREISWERTAQDLAWEVIYNPHLRNLVGCAHVVISFNAAGAFLYSRDDREKQCRLLFDPEVVEGMWEQGYPGRVVGYTSCLTAGIAKEVMLALAEPDIRQGIRAGLSALRHLHREGYGQRGASVGAVNLEFPVSGVVEALRAGDSHFQETAVPMRTGDKYWTILGDQHQSHLEEVAAEVVLQGPEQVLTGVPLGRFGALLTVDRQEIESLRSIRSLVSEYVAQPRPKRPLSIAVFGPPGSGKSFGITELALALRPGEIEPREFNLSQFKSTAELLSAFHLVRDIGLGGKIPLVFWDEFDSDYLSAAYGWLRYFLAPMQDGKFQHGDLVHPIGKAIFVFAGGTCESLDRFGKNVNEDQARAAKIPDFVSRLKGYLNVLGPNPRPGGDDPHYVLRRAILLRAMLKRDAGHVLRNGEVQIDSGVLRAMLQTTTYRHGARSMESVIAMCQLEGKTRFERSSLPTEAQLDLHVDGQNFLALVHHLELEDEVLERLAKAAHTVYCDEQAALGWKYGPHKNEATKENPSLCEFDRLPNDEKEQNRGQVRDIPAKLAHAGCYMVPARENEPPFVFPDEVLEELASMEHTRWMQQKIRDGWRYAPQTDKPKLLHNCMLPWRKEDLAQYAGIAEHLGPEELTEKEKEKDRAAVRQIAAILKHAGYTIVGARNKGGR